MERHISNLKQLGAKEYRFSISWARLCPTGKCADAKDHEKRGIDHYHSFLDLLHAAGIEPFVTLFHWDLPQALQDEYNGWESAKIVDDFADYVRLVFREYGDRVKNWITLNEAELGFWADPIYLTGDYPESILKRYNDSILQRFTDEQKQQNKGSADFFGLNTYTTQLVTDGDKDGKNKGVDWTGHTCPQWPQAGSEWLFSVPWGFRRLLKYIDNRYDSTAVPIFVTENGISSTGNGTDSKPELNDQWRIDHFTSYIGQMRRAIEEDGANVQVYTAWSLMDNFEWSDGYRDRFGLIWTDFSSENRTTLFKQSARFYSDLIQVFL
ncbi:Oidioi.mRNA.OKI2018_I69.PAR.g12830.t1.cds [Oikopleura dioica]|uniref:beta-glucosidase n=1 Tax=Oikopleura dioica TaxID=34765 RepID=A0ABN7S8S5_OIKDI|nr:Oidioi.mRNA.OKI2018_I69.PAR.g12830.t1.cds [Oikopleura dioica]